jgi:hypothetical protein
MNKMLKISLVAVLAVVPLLAQGATANVDKQPVVANPTSDNNVATYGPQYAIMAPSEKDSNVATAGYVKGAYNASIRAINKVASDVAGINSDLTNVATKTGVVATVNQASAEYTPQGSVADVTIKAMGEWGSESETNVTIPGGAFTGTAAVINPTVNQYYAAAPSQEEEEEEEP